MTANWVIQMTANWVIQMTANWAIQMTANWAIQMTAIIIIIAISSFADCAFLLAVMGHGFLHLILDRFGLLNSMYILFFFFFFFFFLTMQQLSLAQKKE